MTPVIMMDNSQYSPSALDISRILHLSRDAIWFGDEVLRSVVATPHIERECSYTPTYGEMWGLDAPVSSHVTRERRSWGIDIRVPLIAWRAAPALERYLHEIQCAVGLRSRFPIRYTSRDGLLDAGVAVIRRGVLYYISPTFCEQECDRDSYVSLELQGCGAPPRGVEFDARALCTISATRDGW